jgi:hypothetical protein
VPSLLAIATISSQTALISFSLFSKPDNEVEEAAGSNNVKSEGAAKTEVPAAETQTAETTVPAVTETKEVEPAVEEPVVPPTQKLEEKIEEPLKPEAKAEAPMTEESTLQAIVDKTQASKAGQLPALETESEGKGKHLNVPADRVKAAEQKLKCRYNAAVLPATTTDTTTAADHYPSTTEAAAEESIGTTGLTAGVVSPNASLPERPKATEVTPVAAVEPAVAPIESEAAHVKRPYEKPIFSNDEVKPHKMAKTEEEQAAASAEADKTALAGAGPASTAAYTVPEPVPVPEKKVEEKEPVAGTEVPAAVAAPQAAPVSTPVTAPAAPSQTKESKASPDAVAAAAAAINSSKATTAPIPVAGTEPRKPEPAAKRGEEPKAKVDLPAETPQETTAPQVAEPEAAKPSEEAQAEPSAEQQPEKKKGGFFAKLKRMFK